MARARNIKPSFFVNEELVELEPFDRLLFIGLWCLADREGRLEDRVKRIKMELFPCDNYDVNEGLESLKRSGFIKRYQVGVFKVVSIINFNKHQAPHSTEKDSDLPDDNGFITVNVRDKSSRVKGESHDINVNDLSVEQIITVKEQLKAGVDQEVSREPNREHSITTQEDNSDLTVKEPLEPVNPLCHNALIPDCGILIPESRILNPEEGVGRNLDRGDFEPASKNFSQKTIPPDFEPDKTGKRFVIENKVDGELEKQKFVAHYQATGESRDCWQASFRKWVLHAAQYNADRAKRQSAGNDRDAKKNAAANAIFGAYVPNQPQPQHNDLGGDHDTIDGECQAI